MESEIQVPNALGQAKGEGQGPCKRKGCVGDKGEMAFKLLTFYMIKVK